MDAPPTAPPRPRGARALRAAVVLGPAALWAALAWRARWVCDDAFIDFRVAENLLAGAGPVFNPGERVEIYTNPLWVALLALGGAATPGPARDSLPWLAVSAGIALAVAGLALPSLAALRAEDSQRSLAVPAGALLVVALRPFHEFASSGLETGLTFGWLGAAWTLVGIGPTPTRSPRRHALVALFLGVGPLVRPELAIYAAAFAALLVLHDPARDRARSAWALAAVALPGVAMQLFRMAYFAALVPAPALAKEASLARWDQGLAYLLDTVRPDALAVPCGALLLACALTRAFDRRSALLLAAAAAHAVYVVRVGGDFMHARMLLAPLFALALATLVARGRARAALVVVLPWALATGLRPPAPGDASADGRGITDERRFYVRAAATDHPVTLADYARTSWVAGGAQLGASAQRGRRGILLGATPGEGAPTAGALPFLRRDARAPIVAAGAHALGLTGVAAGARVHLIDRYGLADPIAARLELARRGRPGHEKNLPPVWVIARWADFAHPAFPPALRDHPRVAAARRALACGPLAELRHATTDPLTPARILANLRVATTLTRLRIPPDPVRAAAVLCH